MRRPAPITNQRTDDQTDRRSGGRRAGDGGSRWRSAGLAAARDLEARDELAAALAEYQKASGYDPSNGHTIPERRVAEAPRLPWQPGGKFFPVLDKYSPDTAASGAILPASGVKDPFARPRYRRHEDCVPSTGGSPRQRDLSSR